MGSWLRRVSRLQVRWLSRLQVRWLGWLWRWLWRWLLLAVGPLPRLLTTGRIPIPLKSSTLWPGSTKSTRHTSSASAAPTVVRSLWGSGKGRFSTVGRYAAATVRGTIWKTDDRCDGTLIYVKRGEVSVLDLVKKKTVIVATGKSYLAKP